MGMNLKHDLPDDFFLDADAPFGERVGVLVAVRYVPFADPCRHHLYTDKLVTDALWRATGHAYERDAETPVRQFFGEYTIPFVLRG